MTQRQKQLQQPNKKGPRSVFSKCLAKDIQPFNQTETTDYADDVTQRCRRLQHAIHKQGQTYLCQDSSAQEGKGHILKRCEKEVLLCCPERPALYSV